MKHFIYQLNLPTTLERRYYFIFIFSDEEVESSSHLPEVAQPGKSRVEFEAKLSGSGVHMYNSYATFPACVVQHHSSKLQTEFVGGRKHERERSH